jgi:hypothetical protein
MNSFFMPSYNSFKAGSNVPNPMFGGGGPFGVSDRMGDRGLEESFEAMQAEGQQRRMAKMLGMGGGLVRNGGTMSNRPPLQPWYRSIPNYQFPSMGRATMEGME